MREDFPSGAVQTGAGPRRRRRQIGELAVGRSGLGDGFVAFRQGPIGNAAIVAAQVTRRRRNFVLTCPNGWVKPSRGRDLAGSRRRAPTVR